MAISGNNTIATAQFAGSIRTNSVIPFGVTKDQAMAASLFREAADQGDAQSQYWLGYCYENGFGVLYDIDEALVWYKAAADQGYGPAIEKVEKLG